MALKHWKFIPGKNHHSAVDPRCGNISFEGIYWNLCYCFCPNWTSQFSLQNRFGKHKDLWVVVPLVICTQMLWAIWIWVGYCDGVNVNYADVVVLGSGSGRSVSVPSLLHPAALSVTQHPLLSLRTSNPSPVGIKRMQVEWGKPPLAVRKSAILGRGRSRRSQNGLYKLCKGCASNNGVLWLFVGKWAAQSLACTYLGGKGMRHFRHNIGLG